MQDDRLVSVQHSITDDDRLAFVLRSSNAVPLHSHPVLFVSTGDICVTHGRRAVLHICGIKVWQAADVQQAALCISMDARLATIPQTSGHLAKDGSETNHPAVIPRSSSTSGKRLAGGWGQVPRFPVRELSLTSYN